jgi:hypothetical protein
MSDDRIDTAYPAEGVTVKVISGESHGVKVCLEAFLFVA